MVVIVWWLGFQLPVQTVPITTKVVSSNPVHGEVCSIQQYVIKFASDLTLFSAGTLVNKIGHQDITEILLKVALSTMNQPTNLIKENHNSSR